MASLLEVTKRICGTCGAACPVGDLRHGLTEQTVVLCAERPFGHDSSYYGSRPPLVSITQPKGVNSSLVFTDCWHPRSG